MGRHLLVWDAPNVDMTLANIIDSKPTAKERPDLDVLGEWLMGRAGAANEVEACVFVNVSPHVAGPMRGWVLWLLEEGFRVFAKPKIADSDVDADMLAHIESRVEEGDLEAVYVGSNDARNFLQPLETLATNGIGVTVLGFAEYAGGLSMSERLRFVDLEDIPGLFAEPLPRINLENLPANGRWFEPTGSLGAAREPRDIAEGVEPHLPRPPAPPPDPGIVAAPRAALG
ncbi:MAG: NYN domain-containing protein [Actinomycetota bacterium]|nr:NYN domain-containing protein [Actinomycetota bacterium]